MGTINPNRSKVITERSVSIQTTALRDVISRFVISFQVSSHCCLCVMCVSFLINDWITLLSAIMSWPQICRLVPPNHPQLRNPALCASPHRGNWCVWVLLASHVYTGHRALWRGCRCCCCCCCCCFYPIYYVRPSFLSPSRS